MDQDTIHGIDDATAKLVFRINEIVGEAMKLSYAYSLLRERGKLDAEASAKLCAIANTNASMAIFKLVRSHYGAKVRANIVPKPSAN